MPRRHKVRARKTRRKRLRPSLFDEQSSMPLTVVNNAKCMRTMQLFAHTQQSKWLDNLLYVGVYALKLFLARANSVNASVSIGAMQAFNIRLDDLLVSSPFNVGGAGTRVRFSKGKLRSLCLKLSSTAAPANRSGRYGMSFVWYSEDEALEVSKDLKRKPTPVLPTLIDFFQSPGVTVSSVTQGITKVWYPPPSSWVRDYVRIGKSSDGASTDSYGLPVGRVILGYQNLDAQDASKSYRSSATAIQLDLIGQVDLAELSERQIPASLTYLLDPTLVGSYTEDGYSDVPSSEFVCRNDGLFVPSSDMVVKPF